MAEIASAFVSLLPSAKGFGSKLDSEISGDLNSSGKKAGGAFGKVFAIGAAAAIGGAVVVGKFLKDSIGEAREAQKVGALTESVIKSTGAAAGITAKQVGDMAGRLSLVTGIDDEVIQSGSNLLLTFKNVKNYVDGEFVGVFDRATAASLDLSAAGFGSVEGASKQLGKALNDPVKGISALSRSGVTFTAQQQEQIKALVASGDAAKAQGIILGEVESQVGGAAAATATYGEKAKVAFGNIQEQVGTALLPALDGFFKLFLGTVPTITRLIDGIGPAFGRVKASVVPVVAGVRAAFGALGGGGATLKALRSSLSTIGGAFSAAFATLSSGSGGGVLASLQSLASTVSANILPALSSLGGIFRSTILPAFTSFTTTLIAQMVPVLQAMANTFQTLILPAIMSLGSYLVASLVPIFQKVSSIVSSQVIPILSSLALFFYGKLYPAVLRIVAAIAVKLKPVFDQLVATVRGQILPTVEKLLVKFREYQPTIQKVVLQFAKIIGAVLTFAAAILGKVLPVVIKFSGYLLSKVVPAVASVIGVIIKIISKVLDFGAALVNATVFAAKFLSGIKEKVGAAFDFVKAIPGKMVAVFTAANTIFYNAGAQLMSRLREGIQNKIEDAIQAVRDGLQKIKNLLPGSPIKDGPLKGWNGGTPGKLLMEMLARGLRIGSKTVQAEMTKVVEKLGKSLDGLKSKFSSLQSDFASIASGVGSAFNSDVFGLGGKDAVTEEVDGIVRVLEPATTALQEFMGGLTGNNSNLTAMLAAFDQLQAAGASKGFLSALFQSGNTALATQLATAGPEAVKQASALFDQNASLAATLGNAVATNELGPKMESVRVEIAELRKDMKALIPLIAKDVAKGAEEGTRKGNDDRNADAKGRKKAGR